MIYQALKETDILSYFKKFTDFCAGLGAFVSALLFIRQYMSFSPDTEEGAPSKPEQFLASSEEGHYHMLITLIFLLILSAAVGRIFQRLPYICFAASILPALHMAFMFERRAFFQLSAFMIVIVALHVIGNIAECVIRDREDGRHRLWVAAKISSVSGALLCFLIIRKLSRPIPELNDGLGPFEKELFSKFTDLDVEIMSKLFWMFVILLGVSLILYNVYFIDAILSLVPAVYATYAMISEELGVASSIFFAATVICAATHICLALMENNLSRKEQQKSKQ